MRDDLAYVRHIMEGIEVIEGHICGVTKKTFFDSLLIQDAVIRRFEIIGEAAKYCGPFGQDKYFSNLRYQRGPLSLRFYCYYYVIFFSPPWLWAVWTTRTRCPSPVVNLIGLSTGRHCPQPVSPDSVSQLSNMPQPVSCRPGTDEASRCCKNSYTC